MRCYYRFIENSVRYNGMQWGAMGNSENENSRTIREFFSRYLDYCRVILNSQNTVRTWWMKMILFNLFFFKLDFRLTFSMIGSMIERNHWGWEWYTNWMAKSTPIFHKSNPRFEKSKTEPHPLVERRYRCRRWARCSSWWPAKFLGKCYRHGDCSWIAVGYTASPLSIFASGWSCSPWCSFTRQHTGYPHGPPQYTHAM